MYTVVYHTSLRGFGKFMTKKKAWDFVKKKGYALSTGMLKGWFLDGKAEVGKPQVWVILYREPRPARELPGRKNKVKPKKGT